MPIFFTILSHIEEEPVRCTTAEVSTMSVFKKGRALRKANDIKEWCGTLSALMTEHWPFQFDGTQSQSATAWTVHGSAQGWMWRVQGEHYWS